MSSIFATIDESLEQKGHVDLSADTLKALDAEAVEAIVERYRSRGLWRLPDHEVLFFEWLRSEDADVWNDLWGDVSEAPYLVSLAYLSDFIGTDPGHYFIRDLQSVDNYFFTPEMILEKESRDFLAALRTRLDKGETLTLAQAFALSVSVGPTDLWHFAHAHGQRVDAVKRAVAALVDDRILVHVPKADHLTDHFDVD